MSLAPKRQIGYEACDARQAKANRERNGDRGVETSIEDAADLVRRAKDVPWTIFFAKFHDEWDFAAIKKVLTSALSRAEALSRLQQHIPGLQLQALNPASLPTAAIPPLLLHVDAIISGGTASIDLRKQFGGDGSTLGHAMSSCAILPRSAQRPKKSRPTADVGLWHLGVAVNATASLSEEVKRDVLDDVSRLLGLYHEYHVASCTAPFLATALGPALISLVRAVEDLVMADKSPATLAASLAPLRRALAEYQEAELTIEAARNGYTAIFGDIEGLRFERAWDKHLEAASAARRAFQKKSANDAREFVSQMKQFVDKFDAQYPVRTSLCNEEDGLPTL